MPRLFLHPFAGLLVALLLLPASSTLARQSTAPVTLEPGQVLLVKLRPASERQVRLRKAAGRFLTGLASLDALNGRFQAVDVRPVFPTSPRFAARRQAFGLDRWYRVTFNRAVRVPALLTYYLGDPNIEVAEVNQLFELFDEPAKAPPSPARPAAATTPNDPSYGSQWHYHNTGQTGGTVDADIDLPEAWDLTTGASNVVVSVLDTGADLDHPDLVANLWVNPGEIPGNGIDDDGNGYVDDVHGYDFSDNDAHPDDYHGHGSHTAGTIAATSNNGVGVAGIAGGNGAAGSGARVMVLKIFPNAYADVISDAFYYAANNGSVISSNSWGGGGQSNLIENAIDYYIATAGGAGFPLQGGLVVFAAGNDNSSSTLAGYPASYAPALAVASTDHRDLRSSFSNYGNWVDIAAPGSSVYSTHRNKGYAYLSGTSMACPHVAGVAALVASSEPGLTAAQLRTRLQDTADDIDALNGSFAGKLGTGRVNAYRALTEGAGPPPDPPNAGVTPTSLAATLDPDQTETQTLSLGNSGDLDLTFDLTLVPAGARTRPQADNYLVWDAAGTGVKIKQALQGLGHSPTTVTSLATVADLSVYDAVFVSLGIRPSKHVLTAAEADRLAAYLDGGGRLFMEGGDTWAADPARSVHAYFGITGASDGADDLSAVDGVSGTFTEGLAYGYRSRFNTSIDRLTPGGGGYAVLSGGAYTTGVANDPGGYRTVGTSFALGALVESGATQQDLLAAVLTFFNAAGGGGGGGDVTWLSATPTTGSVAGGAAATIDVTFDATGLTAGPYEATLRVTSNDPDTPTIDVPVTLTVNDTGASDPPNAGVTPTSLAATLDPDQTETQTLSLGNSGDLDLTFDLTLVPAGARTRPQADNYLVWDAAGTGVKIKQALQGLGHSPTTVTSLATVADLSVYDAVFVSLGIRPSKHVLTAAEADRLAAYLDGGGRLFMEGGDTWAADPARSVHAYFGITGASDGADDLSAVDGVSGTFTEGLAYGYRSRFNTSIDRLTPGGGGYAVLSGGAYTTGVANDPGGYRTVGTSFALGALVESGATQQDLLAAVLTFFNAAGGGGGGGDVTWLSATPTTGSVAGGAAATIDVTFDATGLTAGPYEATLRVTSNDPDTPTIDVPVTLTVNDTGASDPPTLVLTPSAIDATGPAGQVQTQTLTLQNTGDQTLTFDLVASVTAAPSVASELPRFDHQGLGPVPLSVPVRDETGAAVDALRCATPRPSASDVQRASGALSAWREAHPFHPHATLTIPVAFHLLINTSGKGDVSDAVLQQQIDVLNAAFSTRGFQFTLASVSRTVSNDWFRKMDNRITTIMQALAVTPTTTLNIYTGRSSSLGYVLYFPWERPESDYRHGLAADYRTLPGGGLTPYDEGDTIVHEVGHYLGLYHTFQGGCNSPGDDVADTPYEASPAFGCPTGRDTCPAAGLDPIDNFMDYSDDSCMERFTSGQAERMQTTVAAYKPGLGTATLDWLSADPTSGSVAGGASADVTITLDATALDAGTYTGTLALTTNDPAQTSVDVGVSFNVTSTTALARLGEDAFAQQPLATASETAGMPTEFALEPVYPNPFNPSTTFRYALPEAAHVTVAVYDVLGRRLALLVNGAVEAGYHTLTWEARSDLGAVLPSGTYFLRLDAGDFTASQRMVLLK